MSSSEPSLSVNILPVRNFQHGRWTVCVWKPEMLALVTRPKSAPIAVPRMVH